MKSIFGNIGWLLGSRGINAAFSLIYLALATRSLGLQGFGQLAIIVVLGQAVAGVASFNTWQAVVRWGNPERGSEAVTGFALALDLVSMAAGLVLAALVCWRAHLWLPIEPHLRDAAFVFCSAAIIGLRSTPTGLLRLHDRYDLASLAEATLPATRALGAIIAALLIPDIVGFVAAWVVAELACAIAYWICAKQFVRLRYSDISITNLPRAEPEVWRFVIATSLSRTAAVTSKQVLLLGVGAVGGAGMAGGFRVASQLGQALVQLGEVVSRAIYPELVRSADNSARIAGRMAVYATVAGFTGATAAGLGGKWVLTFVAGPEFIFAYPAMVILAVAGALELSGVSWEAALVARKQAVTALLIRAAPLILALGAMPRASEVWGLVGVATCVLFASGLTLAGFGVLASRRSGLSSRAAGVGR